MRYTELLESEFLTDKDDIINWMSESFIHFDPKYLKIESDELVYNSSLNLTTNIYITKLKVQFKSVADYFDCSYTNIISLEGVPKSTGGGFYCHSINISSLEGCPQTIGGDFNCGSTNITSLKFCPKSVVGWFNCGNVKITDPKEYRFALYCEIGSKFESGYMKINKIINTYGGSANRKYWAHAINLLSKVKL